jgi:tetratricopeptide (TPR) repeat protein
MYRTFVSLARSKHWVPVSLGGSVALFVRSDIEGTAWTEYRDQNRIDFAKTAFRTPRALPDQPEYPVEPPRWYYDPLWQTRAAIPESLALASHYLTLSQNLCYAVVQGRRIVIDRPAAVAFDLLAIRTIRDAMAKGPNIDNPLGYWLLAQAYQELLRIEMGLTGAERPVDVHRMRYWQLVAALNQAFTADPKLEFAHRIMADLAFNNYQWDIALKHYQAVAEAVGESNENLLPLYERMAILEHRVTEARERVEAELSAGRSEPLRLARLAVQAGCPLLAIEQLADVPTYTQINRDRQITLSRTYIDVGQAEDAFRAIDVLTNNRNVMAPGQWEEILGTVRLTQGWYEEARSLWQQAMEIQARASVNGYLNGTMQLVGLGEPMSFFEQAAQSAARQPAQDAFGHLHYGMMMMEAGSVDVAAEQMKKVLETEPNVVFRALPAFYLSLLTGEVVDPVRPNDYLLPQFEPDESAESSPPPQQPETPEPPQP